MEYCQVLYSSPKYFYNYLNKGWEKKDYDECYCITSQDEALTFYRSNNQSIYN